MYTLREAVEISWESWQLVMIKVMVWYFVSDTCKVIIALILVVFVLVFLELAQWLTSKCYFLWSLIDMFWVICPSRSPLPWKLAAGCGFAYGPPTKVFQEYCNCCRLSSSKFVRGSSSKCHGVQQQGQVMSKICSVQVYLCSWFLFFNALPFLGQWGCLINSRGAGTEVKRCSTPC